MSVMDAQTKRTLTGRRRARPRSVIANGAPPEVDATGLGPVSTLNPGVVHVIRPGTTHGDLMQLEWEEESVDERHSMVGFGGALLCRALGAMGSLRRPLPVMASVPNNLPGTDRRRRTSVHVLDEFALYDRHRRCSQLPSPPPPPSGPPPSPPDDPPRPPPPMLLPPPPSSIAGDDASGQVTIQVTPASPRCRWGATTSASAETQTTGDAGTPASLGAPVGCNGDATAGWSCAWSRRRRRSSTHGSLGGSERTWSPAEDDDDDEHDLDEVIGYGSECMAGVASAVIAAILTAGVVYWLYAWQHVTAA